MKRRKSILIQVIIASFHNNTKHALVDAMEINQTDRIIRAGMPRIKGYKACKRKRENVKRSKQKKKKQPSVALCAASLPASLNLSGVFFDMLLDSLCCYLSG